MNVYRVASALMALAYLGLATSIQVRPPQPVGDHVSVFEVVATNTWWALVYIVVAAALLIAAGCNSRAAMSNSHGLLMVVMAGFGTANLGTSIVNGTGWQVGALSIALVAGHALAIPPRRP